MTLTDKALSILTFAAYHTLASGQTVRDVVIDDAAGHRADAAGIEEMEASGLLTVQGDRVRLTEEGEAHLASVLNAIRGA